MTYVLLVYDRPDFLSTLSEDERQAIFAEYEALLAVPGLAGHRLAPATNAPTIRIEDGERKEELETEQPPLAGFYLIDTHDRERALKIAARIPAGRLGGAVEVRALVGE